MWCAFIYLFSYVNYSFTDPNRWLGFAWMVYDDYVGCIWGPHQVCTGGSSTASPRVDNTFSPTPSSLSSRPQSSRCYCHQFSHCRMGSATCTGVFKCIAYFCISSALHLAVHYQLHRLYDVKVWGDCQ